MTHQSTVYLVQYYSDRWQQWVDVNGTPCTEDEARRMKREYERDLPNQRYRIDPISLADVAAVGGST